MVEPWLSDCRPTLGPGVLTVAAPIAASRSGCVHSYTRELCRKYEAFTTSTFLICHSFVLQHPSLPHPKASQVIRLKHHCRLPQESGLLLSRCLVLF